MSTEEKNNEEWESPYCSVCDACGEEGCCSALCCHQSPNGDYCSGYIRDLRFGYRMYKDMWDLIPKDTETQEKLDAIYDKNYDIEYRSNN
jgi:hypothetical protein